MVNSEVTAPTSPPRTTAVPRPLPNLCFFPREHRRELAAADEPLPPNPRGDSAHSRSAVPLGKLPLLQLSSPVDRRTETVAGFFGTGLGVVGTALRGRRRRRREARIGVGVGRLERTRRSPDAHLCPVPASAASRRSSASLASRPRARSRPLGSSRQVNPAPASTMHSTATPTPTPVIST
jgi:hypothetical protein